MTAWPSEWDWQPKHEPCLAIRSSGVTVIPVARARWGFGGGSGDNPEGRGSGGGGGVGVAPLGYIEVRDGSAEFRPIRDPRFPLVLAGALVVLGAILVRGAR